MLLLSGPLAPSADQAGVPSGDVTGAKDPMQMPTQFEQSVGVSLEQSDASSEVDGVVQMRGQISTYTVERDDDSRLTGTGRFVFDADAYGEFGPEWGTFRLENEDGAWQGTLSGFHNRHETRLSGWLVGDGAYEGLSQYREMVVDHGSFKAVIKGVIIPGDPPQDPPVFE